MSERLFSDLDARPTVDATVEAPPRYEVANRAQIELTPCDLESLLPPGHAARLVWRFVEGVDLSAFYTAIRAREGHVGRSPIDPKILIALWLYATIDGVGSAREVDRLCTSHDAYRWLRGGVSVNYHTLSDFRVNHQAALDALLTQSIAVLVHRRVVTLARVAQDGTRVRASAGAASFRRGATLKDCLREAHKHVARVARQTDGPAASASEAAQARAARERLARVEAALAELPQVTATIASTREPRASTREPRVSTTDPEARVMKMADGGFRPAYNIHFATDVDSRVIVGVHTTQVGTDFAQLLPMMADLDRRLAQSPRAYLADGGLITKRTVTTLAARAITVYAPLPTRQGRGCRPATVCRTDDTPAVRAWRGRMSTPEGQALYRARAATAEWVNADLRTHRALGRLNLRGLRKVHTWALWMALAHNMLRTMDIVPHLMT